MSYLDEFYFDQRLFSQQYPPNFPGKRGALLTAECFVEEIALSESYFESGEREDNRSSQSIFVILTFDLKILLNPLEEQLNFPALLIRSHQLC